MKKILIISRAFYPTNSPRSFRTSELAKEFSRQGHEVTVITPKVHGVHDAFEKQHNIRITDLGQQTWKTPDFGKSKLGYLLTRATYRLLNLAFEYPDIQFTKLVLKALKKERDYDLLISIAVPYPIHWGVAKVWEKGGAIARTWVADCGDPYYGNKMDSFRKWFYFKWVEKWFMRKADFISITNINFKVNYFPEFHDKMVEIPQGFNFEDINLFEGKIKHAMPHFAFAGSLIPIKRDPSKLLAYLISLDQDYRFILYTSTPELVAPYAEKSNGRIIIKGFIPRDKLIFELSKMDFLVNFEFNPKEQSPSKLIDYGLTKRPILNIISKEFNPSIVDEFLRGNYSNKFIFQDFNQYRIENVCKKFLDLVD